MCHWSKAALIYCRLDVRDLDRRQGVWLNQGVFDNIGFDGFREGRVALPYAASSVRDQPS